MGTQLHTRLARQLSVCTNLGTALACPTVNLEPVEWADSADRLVIVVSRESSETVVNSQRLVALGKTVRNSSTYCSVHATSRGTNIDEANSHALSSQLSVRGTIMQS